VIKEKFEPKLHAEGAIVKVRTNNKSNWTLRTSQLFRGLTNRPGSAISSKAGSLLEAYITELRAAWLCLAKQFPSTHFSRARKWPGISRRRIMKTLPFLNLGQQNKGAKQIQAIRKVLMARLMSIRQCSKNETKRWRAKLRMSFSRKAKAIKL
jgi:hypothetical protein